ncbi:MAG: transcriptional repressor [Chloroflexi bacterium]|nr:transcriptional repressor [Chloroflexota bacterium]
MNSLSRHTRQKEIILEILQEADTHLDALQIFERASQKMPRLSLATVYRNLKSMSEQGAIAVGNFGEGHAHYEIVNTLSSGHHHLKCLSCGNIWEFDRSAAQLVTGVKEVNGFKIYSARLYIEGLCLLCQKKETC